MTRRGVPPSAPRTAGSARRGRQGAQPTQEGRARREAAPATAARRRRLPGPLRLAVLLAVWLALGGAGLVLWLAWDLPDPHAALQATRPPAVTLLAADGSLVRGGGPAVGLAVVPGRVPRHLVDAVLAIEDRRFFEHAGIDPRGLGRALVANLAAGRTEQGGSTLTQQVAKNLFLSPSRTLKRKGQEALLALWLEASFDKDAILAAWLNRTYFGAGAIGVDAASRSYFGRPASALTLGQAALIAGLAKAPSRLNPLADRDAALARARLVLRAMVETGRTTREAAGVAAAALDAERFAPSGSGSSWFASFARAELAQRQGALAEDATARTTLDPELQRAAEAELERTLQALDGVDGAVVALDPANGAIRALVGGRGRTGFDGATQARRQPGSAWKPVVWLAALEDGWLPETTIEDAPVTIRGWSPRNFDGRYRGTVTLAEALALSLNTVSARLVERVGARAVAGAGRRLGVETPVGLDPSLALGTSEVTLLELTAAYAPFANGGLRVFPHAVAELRGEGGRVLYRLEPRGLRATDAANAARMRAMLERAVASGTGRAAAIPGSVVAGKTGTTQEFRDAWFVGFVPGVVLGIRLGRDDGRPMDGIAGSGAPAETFRRILLRARSGG